MLTNYGYVGLFLIIALGFAVTTLLIPQVLKRLKIVPDRPNQVKLEPFECGMRTIGKTWVQFNFRYYFYALIFLALDVMAVFLYPWVAQLRQLGSEAFFILLLFISVIVIGYVYAWKKKALEWQ